MDGEENPLLSDGGSRSGASFFKSLSIVLGFFFVAGVVSSVLLGVLLYQKNQEVHSPPPYDHSDDFPLRTPGPWDINKDHKRKEIFTLTEGTWMNLDVSPDGKEIIFDLLGDIYAMPITGGKATVLRKGVPFEVQPRYSHGDGKYVLFTSDLSGCENLWYFNRSTPTEAHQITDEKYHFVSNGWWRDANSVVGVKWYTSTRSIPAGELWLYDLKVNETSTGKRIRGRVAPGSQVGPEEPFVSNADPQSVFFSRNVADTTVFNYNKNPHSVIYSIFKYNIKTGESTTIARGPGGAARPTVSHDGKKLAYIKRTIYKTSLILHDLETGNEVQVYDGMDFDQQESSAAAGVYPAFAFTPDDSAIIAWAKGKIWNINLSTGNAIQIPFSVDVEIDLADTLRFSHNISVPVSPQSGKRPFRTKVATSPSLNRDGTKVVFGSLGSVYLQTLSNAGKQEPVELVSSTESTFHSSPSFSSDGNYVTYVSWSDTDFAKIYILDTNTTKQYLVPNEKGRYSEPRFSPNMDQIVYVRHGKDGLTGNSWGLREGLYVHNITSNADGTLTIGPAKLLTKEGSSAWYTQDGQSLYVYNGDYPSHLNKISSKKQSSTVETIATSQYATDIRVSPNGEYVAFVEWRNVYISALDKRREGAVNVTSRVNEITSNTRPPVQVGSTAGGNYISWSADSTRLYWALGSTLYSVEVTEKSLSSCQDQLCLHKTLKSYDISVGATAGVADTYVVFDNATLIPMEGTEKTIPNAKIVVKGDRIEAMGPRDTIANPVGATVRDLAGGFVLPGFIDAHAHWDGAWTSPYKTVASWELYVNLAFGVTTMHNPSADTISIFEDAELVKAGKKIGPRILSTGSILYGAGGPLHCEMTTEEDASNFIKNLQAYGAWSVKSYNQPCRSARQKILAAARKLKVNVVPEGGMAYYWNVNEIIDGHTTIEHSLPVSPLYQDVIQLFVKSGTAWTPTFIVNYGGIWGKNYWFQHTNVWEDKRLMAYVPHQLVQSQTMRRVAAEDNDYHHFKTAATANAISEAGGIVQTGAHGEMQGIGIHWEMKMFRQGNMTSWNVLRAATINPARALGLDHEIGSLKVGKLADLIIYDAATNPLDDIDLTSSIKQVMKDGVLFDAETLDQILPTPKKRPVLPPLNMPVLGQHK